MNALFIILAFVTVASGIAAISMRNLVHCALFFAASLVGVAGIFLWLGAQFLGFAQVLVYVGAISILVVFAILLTRGAGNENGPRFFGSPLVGAAIALMIGGVLLTCVWSSSATAMTSAAPARATVREIGEKLMTTHVLTLEIMALVLTVALLGAVTLAMPEGKRS
jgi:NADH-quinone oxidoreductase subunit J